MHSCDILTIEDAYDALFSKEKMMHLVESEAGDKEALLFMVIKEGISRGQIFVIRYATITRINDTLKWIATNRKTKVI